MMAPMNPSSLADLTIAELARRLKARRVTAIDAVEACLERIRERDGELNAFISVAADQAREEARRVDAAIRRGRYRGPLDGVPVSLKDLIDVAGQPTTAASRVRANEMAAGDAPVVVRLRRAGAIVLGKCNLHEFALGTTGEDSAYGPTRNPHEITRSPGGSSSGSAVAVATGMSFGSIGTDTGGSIRIPAAACGVVGLKPTFGELSCDGVVPLSRSLDHVGPLGRTVEDAWLLYQAMAGRRPLQHRHKHGTRPRRRLALLAGYFLELLDSEVRHAFESAVTRLKRRGCLIEEAEIAHASDIGTVYVNILLPEAAEFHAKTLDTRAGDYTSNVRLRLEMGRRVLAEDYIRAQRGREILRMEVEAALAGRDALILPTLPVPAPPLGTQTVTIDGVSEPVHNVMRRLTQLFDLTGHPAVSIPCGVTSAGLPCGLQLVGALGRTDDLMALAAALESGLTGQGAGIKR
jgi:aspartyl-tRNA(Asn)/glutamyl-tRNA(Gln) amidotransferase subunit A